MAKHQETSHDLLAGVVALVGLALTALTFTDVPFVSGAGSFIGVLLALPAEAYLFVGIWRRFLS